MTAVFVYGTLTDPDTAASVLSAYDDDGRATLSGLQRVEGRYPTLVPGDSVTGRILTTPDIDRLDRYEGVDDGLYVRITVPTASGEHVEIYVGDPSRLDAPGTWPGSGSFAERVRAYVADNPVECRRH